MDSNTAFIISQVLVVIGYVFNCLSFYTKSRGRLIFIGSTMNVFIGLSLVFLNAWAGVVCQIIAIVRNIVFYFTQKQGTGKYKVLDYIWLVVFSAALIAGGLLTYDQWYSTMPIISGLFYTYGVWQKQPLYFKYYVFFSSVTMIIYYVFIWSPFAVVLESVAFVAIVVSIIKQLYEMNKNKKERTTEVTQKDFLEKDVQNEANKQNGTQQN